MYSSKIFIFCSNFSFCEVKNSGDFINSTFRSPKKGSVRASSTTSSKYASSKSYVTTLNSRSSSSSASVVISFIVSFIKKASVPYSKYNGANCFFLIFLCISLILFPTP
ncbi:Uncharacterised protein [Streptococcus pneumoniae]|nr:Uncharacterised protein [Streptococcus pneumoniae]CJC41906.1 Uncharacterised protein [Streptococcus pneumoniae]